MNASTTRTLRAARGACTCSWFSRPNMEFHGTKVLNAAEVTPSTEPRSGVPTRDPATHAWVLLLTDSGAFTEETGPVHYVAILTRYPDGCSHQTLEPSLVEQDAADQFAVYLDAHRPEPLPSF